jgi:hypothetical protein
MAHKGEVKVVVRTVLVRRFVLAVLLLSGIKILIE